MFAFSDIRGHPVNDNTGHALFKTGLSDVHEVLKVQIYLGSTLCEF